MDDYFESDIKKDAESTTSQELLSQDKPFASALSDLNCMAHGSDSDEPLRSLMEVRSILYIPMLVCLPLLNCVVDILCTYILSFRW